MNINKSKVPIADREFKLMDIEPLVSSNIN